MKNILVTGANGFVGKAVIKEILNRGYTPIALIKDYNRKTDMELMSKVIKHGAEIRGSLLDRDLIREIVGKYELDYVIHLAAMPIVKVCDSDPWTAYNVNMMGSVILYEALRDQVQRNSRLTKIIHMSTDKSYGDSSPPGGYVEDTPFQVTDTYCTSKACGDMIARSYAKTYDLPISIVRCGNLYGGGDLNLSRLIPGTVLRLLNSQQPVLYTDAAGMLREFVHVSDIVSAYFTLMEKGVAGEAYNVGIGKMYKIVDVINMIREQINPDIEIKMVDRDFFEINEQCLNSDKLRALGWTHKLDLNAGLTEAISWYTQWLQNSERD